LAGDAQPKLVQWLLYPPPPPPQFKPPWSLQFHGHRRKPVIQLCDLMCAMTGKNKAIVVGNAQPELVEWLLRQPQNDRIVYTDAHIARGILEGMARHGLY